MFAWCASGVGVGVARQCLGGVAALGGAARVQTPTFRQLGTAQGINQTNKVHMALTRGFKETVAALGSKRLSFRAGFAG
jgi:hypothetical protein